MKAEDALPGKKETSERARRKPPWIGHLLNYLLCLCAAPAFPVLYLVIADKTPSNKKSFMLAGLTQSPTYFALDLYIVMWLCVAALWKIYSSRKNPWALHCLAAGLALSHPLWFVVYILVVCIVIPFPVPG